MFSSGVLCFVFVVTASVVTFALRERASLAKEVRAVASGIERRTEFQGEAKSGEPAGTKLQLEELLDEAVQVESYQLAVLAVSELTGRASLRRNRAILFSRGLPRVALLSGGGGGFFIAAAGNFSLSSLAFAGGSVLLGLIGSFSSFAVNAASRRLAKQYLGIVDVLGREVDRHFRPEGAVEAVEPKGNSIAH